MKHQTHVGKQGNKKNNVDALSKRSLNTQPEALLEPNMSCIVQGQAQSNRVSNIFNFVILGFL
jgi:hypothetical protein